MSPASLKLVASTVPGAGDWFASLSERYIPKDVQFLREVVEFVTEKHDTDLTRQGVPLREHVSAVGGILSELRMDRDAIAAGLLR